jgi:hypothetical protein
MLQVILKTNKMKNVIKYALVIITALSTQAAVAQNAATTNEAGTDRKNYSKHGIGAVLSSSNGKGLAYRYWPKNFGVQVSFVPYASNSEQYYNGGITFYQRLKSYSVGDLFLHAGVEYQYQQNERYYYDTYFSSYYQSYDVRSNGVNIGFGPGYHFALKSVSFDCFFGYGAYIRDESSTFVGADLNDRTVMTVSGGIAVFLNL